MHKQAVKSWLGFSLCSWLIDLSGINQDDNKSAAFDGKASNFEDYVSIPIRDFVERLD